MTTQFYWYNPVMEVHYGEARSLYEAFRDMKMLKSLFWQYPEEISAEGFVGMFSDPCRRILFTIYDGQTLAGGIWIDSLYPGISCVAAMGILPAFRGPTSVRAAEMVLKHIQEGLVFKTVWSMTPHLAAVALVRTLGFERVAELPGFAVMDNAPRSVFVYRKEGT